MSILMEGDSAKITRGVLTAAQIAIYNFRSRTVTGEHSGENRHIYNTPLVWSWPTKDTAAYVTLT